MNSLPLLSSPLAHALGWALLHLLWQGVIVAGILAAALRLLKNQSANTRYAVSCTALALLLVLGIATAYRAYDPVVPQPVASAAEAKVEPLTLGDVPKIIFAAEATETLKSRAASFARSAQTSLPWIVLTWLCGVVVLSSRLTLGWIQTRRIARRNAQPASMQWQRIAKRLAGALQLRRAVTLLESSAVEVPSVIGWLRPVVLLPGSTLTGLTPEQIEMVLAHELAHIRRHDFFVNLLQAFVETLMFYHPAVWWISSQVRIERENCCDDLAVAVCGNPIQYARALTRLEELRATTPAIAVAANGGSLLERIRRIAAGVPEALTRDDATATTSRWAAAIAVLSIVGLALIVPAIPALAQRDEAKAAPQASTARVDVVDRRSAPEIAGHEDIDHIDIALDDMDIDIDDMDIDIDAMDFDMPEPPEPPEAPEAPEFDFDFDFDPDVDIAMVAPVPPTPMVAPVPNVHPAPVAPVAPMAPAMARALAHADMAEHGDHDFDDDDHDDSDRDDDGLRPDGSLSVDALVRLRATGVTPEYLNEMRALFPKASLNDITGARAVGVNREYINSLKSAGVPVDSLNLIRKLRAIGVQPEYIREVRAIDSNATYEDVAQARAVGITSEYVDSLRKAGFQIADIDDATRFKAVGVTAEYAKEMRGAHPNVTAKEIAEAKAVGVTRAYIDAMKGSGIGVDSLRDAVRLRAVGVTADYIKDMRAAGVKIDDAREASQLSAMGVRPEFVRRLAAAGYSNLSVRELTRLAAVGVDDEFLRDLKKYRADDKAKDKNK